MSDAPFSCRQVVELVTEYLDGGLASDQRLAFEQHVSICPPCRGYFGQLRLITRTAGTLTEEDVPEHLRESILAAFKDWKAEQKSR